MTLCTFTFLLFACGAGCAPQAENFWSPTMDELPVISKAFDLAKEMTERTRKFPRDLRLVLGDRVLTTTYDVVDLLLEAKYSRSKRAILDRVNLLLERLRFQVRLCVEERLMTVHQYEYLAEMIQQTGRMTGGWRKSAAE
jgi:hypothetical protein